MLWPAIRKPRTSNNELFRPGLIATRFAFEPGLFATEPELNATSQQ